MQPMAKREPSSGTSGGAPALAGPSGEAVADREAAALAELVQEAAAGDQRAWGDLVGRYGPRVFAMARSRLGDRDAAEDIVQSVFATLARTLNRLATGADREATSSAAETGYEERGRFEAWLFRITMNRVRDEVRRRKSRAMAMEPDAVAELSPAIEVSGPLDSETDPGVPALRRAMGGLSEADREIVELRHHAQMAFKDIAELLGQPIGTVLARHHRALKKLRQLMENEG